MNALSEIVSDQRQRGLDRFDAILITNRNMEPEFPFDSVAFLGDTRFHGGYEFYAVFNQWGCAGIYRTQRCDSGVSFSLDNWPRQPSFVIPIEDIPSMDLRLVEGVARPFSGAFGRFLADRFMPMEDWS